MIDELAENKKNWLKYLVPSEAGGGGRSFYIGINREISCMPRKYYDRWVAK